MVLPSQVLLITLSAIVLQSLHYMGLNVSSRTRSCWAARRGHWMAQHFGWSDDKRHSSNVYRSAVNTVALELRCPKFRSDSLHFIALLRVTL